jgi:hypothetical protein
MDYSEFIGRKSFCPVQSGFDPDLSWYPALKDFQRDIVRWACNRGRAAIFAGTGLGKTLMQLVWADRVTDRTGRPVLILAPLAVSGQTIEEGQKFGVGVERLAGDVFGRGIYITNYEQLHKIDCSQFSGIVLDESSIVKGFDGRLRKQITKLFKNTPYKLSCTATPSPNDLMEFGTQCEFLGIMSHTEMLAMFFIHDGEDTSKWRLKGHGRAKFWEWLSTWSVVIRNPGDYGYDSTGYDLPTSKANDGYIGIRDFRGDLIRKFQEYGFIFHSEVCIWKDPVVAMQRTKALGLLHKTIKKDSSMSRQGIPDYLVVMRKPGDNDKAIEGEFRYFVGDELMHNFAQFEREDGRVVQLPDYERGATGIDIWQRYASPVWHDIKQTNTLNFREGRESDDERHICPLQLDVIERAMQMWSMPGDVVLTPFLGIGSEAYVAVSMGRKAIGVELKASYFNLAVRNVEQAERQQYDLFGG